MEYRLEKESGPLHAKIYTVRLHLGQKEYVGTERTMQLAQRAAAQSALADQDESFHLPGKMSKGRSETCLDTSFSFSASPSPVVILNHWAVRNHLRANFVFLNDQFVTIANQPRHLCFYRLHLGSDLHFDGHGSSHQQARTHCALNALNFLRQKPLSPPSTPQLTSPKKTRTTKSDISLMYERAKQLGLTVRTEWKDPLTVTYRIGEEYVSTGQGFNRHSAKQQAAERMLSILPVDDDQAIPTINPITRLYQLAQARQVHLEFSSRGQRLVGRRQVHHSNPVRRKRRGRRSRPDEAIGQTSRCRAPVGEIRADDRLASSTAQRFAQTAGTQREDREETCTVRRRSDQKR